MTKPTTSPGTKKTGDASGEKKTPHAPGQGKGGGSAPTSTTDNTENLPAPTENHNEQFDRGETKKPAAQEKGSALTTLTARAEGTENRYEGDFTISEWISQVFHEKNDLPVATRAVLAALGVRMDADGSVSIGIREIGVAAGIDSEKTVSKHTKLAEEEGWIVRYHDYQDGSRIRYEARKKNHE